MSFDGSERPVLSTESWNASLSDRFGGLVAAPTRDPQPVGEFRNVRLGHVDAFTIRGNPQTLRRTSRAARRHSSESLKLCAMTSGRAVLHQGDRELVAPPGRLVLYDLAKPYELHFDGPWTCAVITFSRPALALSANDVDHILERTFDIRRGAGALLTGYITSSASEVGPIDDSSAPLLGDAAMNLVNALLSSCPGEPGTSAIEIRRQALQHIRRYARDPDLSVPTVASALHVSARTLQRHFEDYGRTLSELIRSERLEGVHRDLTNPRLADRTIAAIAARWGFLDATSFSRTFRAAYGRSPSEVRAAAGARIVA
ncbi:helix-turn-helix domain-containing protein [Prescottella equi]